MAVTRVTTSRISAVLAVLTGCFDPVSGDYTLAISNEQNTCAAYEPPHTLSVDVDAPASMTLGTGDDVSTCSLTGRTFDCSQTDALDYEGLDVTYTATVTTEGEWSTNRRFSGEVSWDFECDGTDCAQDAATICQGSAAFQASMPLPK